MTTPKRQLGLFDATCIIVGIIIGSGIYKTTPFIAFNVAKSEWLIIAWSLGGLVALLGAMCYAELTTAYPEEGGDYVYLTRAFGRHAGFLFAWAEYWIVRPGNVGMMAFVFATFAAGMIWSSGDTVVGQLLLACGSVVVLTILNVLGVQSGKLTQNVLATAKVIGLAAIIVVGLFIAPPHPGRVSVEKDATSTAAVEAGNEQGEDAPQGDFRLAMILILFTYGGWNEISYVAAEVRQPERNLFRALLFGIIGVTLLYVLVNLAFLRTLGMEGTSNSNDVAADVFRISYGDWGARAMSVLVCVSSLGAINGMLFTGARIYYAVGNEHRLVAALGKWSGRLDSPVRALVLQAIISIALIVGFGFYEEGFLRLTYFTTPVYWFFAFMVGISLMVLRWKDAGRTRPHKVLLYPWTPLFFCLTCAVLCESSFTFALSQKSPEAFWAIGLMLIGIVVALVFDRDKQG